MPRPLQALICAAMLAGCTSVGGTLSPGLQEAANRYPPMILGANVHPTDGSLVPRACPAPGSRVELKGGPVMAFNGADPANPELCRMSIDTDAAQGWFGIWLTDWGGAEDGHAALARIMRAPSGTVLGFDTDMGPDHRYRDLIRNEGVEDIQLLGRNYQALKISHYREGLDSNAYRSVSTVWKDIPSGVLIYGTYQHVAGAPEIDDPLIPTRIVTVP